MISAKTFSVYQMTYKTLALTSTLEQSQRVADMGKQREEKSCSVLGAFLQRNKCPMKLKTQSALVSSVVYKVNKKAITQQPPRFPDFLMDMHFSMTNHDSFR